MQLLSHHKGILTQQKKTTLQFPGWMTPPFKRLSLSCAPCSCSQGYAQTPPQLIFDSVVSLFELSRHGYCISPGKVGSHQLSCPWEVIGPNGTATYIILLDGCNVPIKLPSKHVGLYPEIALFSGKQVTGFDTVVYFLTTSGHL